MHKKYTGQSLIIDCRLRKKLKQQTGMVSETIHTQNSALYAFYVISPELAIAKKPSAHGSVIKKCAIEMAKAFEDTNMVEKFELLPLSNQTLQRRIIDKREQIQKSVNCLTEKSTLFLFILTKVLTKLA